MTRAYQDPAILSAVWQAIWHLIPKPDTADHPLGCHRKRVSDFLCFKGLWMRLIDGSSWVDIEAKLDCKVSDTTLRARRDEWIQAGVFDQIEAQAIEAYDRIIGLDLSHVAADGSIHKAPCGGQATGKSPVDRGKLGHKWSIAVDANGIPIGVALGGANVNDIKLLEPMLDSVARIGLDRDIELLCLDRGYDFPKIRRILNDRGYTELDIQQRGTKPAPGTPHRLTLGLRWIVEVANSWLSNYGQLRRNTDRKLDCRLAAYQLAVTILITTRLVDYRNRWQHQ